MNIPSIEQVVSQFRSQGYSSIKKFVSAEDVIVARSEIDIALSNQETVKDNRFLYWKGAKSVPERIEPIVDVSPIISNICKSNRMWTLLLEIFGEAVPTKYSVLVDTLDNSLI